MKRIALVMVALLLSGCSLIGSTSWDKVEVDFSAGTTDAGDYQLVVTPKQVTYTADGDTTSQDLPEGAWTALATGLGALGARTSEPCPDGQFLEVRAKAGDQVKQTFQASSCDAGDAFDQVQALLEQVIE
ncbi:MAG TPA: hypothetical protein PKV13_11605, partial [Propionicimonas sp.]|nr:hypothetical protein [Propionicimonas sp.]HRA07246.1 hypothetical protein [Propionicimonas sp.]